MNLQESNMEFMYNKMSLFQTPLILVDSSYIVHYLANSTWTWWNHTISDDSYIKDGSFNPMLDAEYKAHLKQQFFYKIIKVVNKMTPIIDKKKIIFALDCRKKDIWRNHYYKQYKITRKTQDSKAEFNIVPVFQYAINTLIPNLCDQYGCKVISHDNSEGDDVIASIALNIKHDIKPIVVANDHDLIQLQDYVDIVNLKGDKLKSDLTTKKFVYEKVVKGDSSDDIPGIFPKYTRVKKYLDNINLLKEELKKDPILLENFHRNYKIMDLKKIPSVVSNDIIKQYNKLFEVEDDICLL